MNELFVFPLNNSVLFKKVTLPYHIFEHRYRQMIKDAIEYNRPIAIAPFSPTGRYHDQICVAGHPHILNHYEDGRLDIYITGSIKCKLKHLVSEKPYKIYTFEEIEERVFVNEDVEDNLDFLRELIDRWAFKYLEDEEQRMNFSRTLYDPELLVNYSAVFLIDEINVKKDVMEAGNIKKKIQIILKSLGPKEVPLGPFMPALRF